MHAAITEGSGAASTAARILRKKLAIDEDQRLRYFKPCISLHCLLQLAPYLPYCSDDKTVSRRLPRDRAIRYPYMQVNQRDMLAWMIFDLDHDNPSAWEDAGLALSNLIVRDWISNRSQLY